MLEAIGLVILSIVGIFPLVALFAVLKALFPRVVENAKSIADAAPARAFGIGLVNSLFFGIICLALAAVVEGLGWQIFAIPLFLVLAVLTIAAMMGLAIMAQLVGARLKHDWSPLQRSVWGGLALTLACYTPVLGWFIVLPYVLLVGFGAFILALLRRGNSKQ